MSALLSLSTSAQPLIAHANDELHRWGGGPPFPFWVFPLLWVVVLAGIALLVVLGRRRRDRQVGRVAGEQVLAERYAAGEIHEAEYRARRAVLREKR